MLDARSEMTPFSDYSGPKCSLCLVLTICGLVGDIDDLLLPEIVRAYFTEDIQGFKW